MRRVQFGRVVAGLGLAAFLVAAGPAAAIEWGNLFGGGSGDDKPKAPANAQTEDVGCPDVQILDGTAGHRVGHRRSGERWSVVRERETMDDLMRGEHLPDWMK